MRKSISIILLFVIINNINANQSFFSDKEMLPVVEIGVDYIYNMQIDKAEVIFDTLKTKYPDHPVRYLYEALMIYWGNFPVDPLTQIGKRYVNLLTKTISISDKMLEQNSEDFEGLFFNMIPKLMLMEVYADNGMPRNAITYIISAYKHVIKCFDYKEEFVEFYFTTGLYNYYRESYPDAHPFYKPFVFFFPKGNAKLGLQQLEYSWENSIFMGPESMNFHTYISISFEKDYKKGLISANKLREKYPNNLLYMSYQIQMLLMLKEYSKAKPVIQKLVKSSNKYFQLLGYAYSGIIQEHLNRNYKVAEKLYWKAIEMTKDFNVYANVPASYAYFGLSRIYKVYNDYNKSKLYLKKAKDLANYEHINFD